MRLLQTSQGHIVVRNKAWWRMRSLVCLLLVSALSGCASQLPGASIRHANSTPKTNAIVKTVERLVYRPSACPQGARRPERRCPELHPTVYPDASSLTELQSKLDRALARNQDSQKENDQLRSEIAKFRAESKDQIIVTKDEFRYCQSLNKVACNATQSKTTPGAFQCSWSGSAYKDKLHIARTRTECIPSSLYNLVKTENSQ